MQATQLIAGVALARLLTPEDFGVMASLAIISGFTVLFFDLGVAAALVQLDDLSQDDLNSAFWLNALGGVLFAGVLAAVSPLVADFFDEPRLTWLGPLTALAFTFSLGVCHFALLERQLQFKVLALAELAATVFGFTVAVVLAALGAGVVSLAVLQIAQAAALSLLLWLRVPWRPSGFVKRASLDRIWRFSGGMLGFNAVNYWARNVDNLVIGRTFGVTPLAFYNRAYNLMLLPVQQVSQILGRVLFPVLTAMGDDHQRVQAAYRRALRVINALTTPVLIGLAAAAPSAVPLLYGPQWTESVPLLQILAIAGVPQCLTASAGWLFQSQGRTMSMFRLGLFNTLILVAAVLLGARVGQVEGVAWSVLAYSWAVAPYTMSVACRLVGLRGSRVLVDAVPTLLISALMGVACWFTPLVLGASRDEGWMVGAQIVVGICVYGILIAVLQPQLIRDLRGIRGSAQTSG